MKEDSEVQDRLDRALTPKLIAPIPWVSGLEHILEEAEAEAVQEASQERNLEEAQTESTEQAKMTNFSQD